MTNSRLIIGLDFGTTYTGVSICEATDDGSETKQIHVIRDWPSRHTKIGTKEKVPSEIAYLNNGTEYGSNIAPNTPRHMWMKLQLDRQQSGEAKKIQQELAMMDGESKKRPVDVIADFLTHVKDHLVKNLDEQYGKQLWRTLPMVLVVTVPAVWSDLAKSRTMEAIRAAGFHRNGFPRLVEVISVTEPEAAAIFTIGTLRGGAQDKQLSVGDGFIVCDMGGGTVDLISYRVAGLQPTVIEEATVGTGDLCGGSFVDRAFIQWLEDKLGVKDFLKIAAYRAQDMPRVLLSHRLGRIVSDFVMEAKTGFSGIEHNFLRLPSPLSSLDDDETRGISDGEIAITPIELASMFKFSIDKTCELIREQLEQAQSYKEVDIKLVFLVGGFAESPYTYAQIKAFGERLGLTVIRPADAWSAVVRGAAVKGLSIKGEALVKNRKCRRHYGTRHSITFVPWLHPEHKSYICPYSDKKMVSDRAKWLLKKGQDLSASETTHAEFQLGYHCRASEKKDLVMDLLASDMNEAAEWASDPSVYKVAILNVDFSDVPQNLFMIRRSVYGGTYYELLVTIKISLESALDFYIMVNGKSYGSVTATYEA